MSDQMSSALEEAGVPKPIFLKLRHFKAWLQETADLTQQPTTLYNDEGIARMAITGWPMRGRAIATAEPRSRVEDR